MKLCSIKNCENVAVMGAWWRGTYRAVCRTHWDRVIPRLKEWAAGDSTEYNRQRAVEWLKENQGV